MQPHIAKKVDAGFGDGLHLDEMAEGGQDRGVHIVTTEGVLVLRQQALEGLKGRGQQNFRCGTARTSSLAL